jgi:hypothetical protein
VSEVVLSGQACYALTLVCFDGSCDMVGAPMANHGKNFTMGPFIKRDDQNPEGYPTPEMIAAGIKILETSGIADDYSPTAELTLAEIYLAMFALHPHSCLEVSHDAGT